MNEAINLKQYNMHLHLVKVSVNVDNKKYFTIRFRMIANDEQKHSKSFRDYFFGSSFENKTQFHIFP